MIRNSLFDTLRGCDFFLDEMDVDPRRPSSPGSSLCNPLPRCHSLSVRFPGAAGYLLDHNKVLLMIGDEQESVVADTPAGDALPFLAPGSFHVPLAGVGLPFGEDARHALLNGFR